MTLPEPPGGWLPGTMLRTAMTAATAAATTAATPGAWPTVLRLPGHRLFIVATPPEHPLMLTRVHLNGSVQTKLCKDWYGTATRTEVEAVGAEHHRKLAAGLAGWPAIIAALHLTSWGGGAWLAGSVLYHAVAAANQALHDAAPGWTPWSLHLWLPLVPLALGKGVRFGMRAWFRSRLKLGGLAAPPTPAPPAAPPGPRPSAGR